LICGKETQKEEQKELQHKKKKINNASMVKSRKTPSIWVTIIQEITKKEKSPTFDAKQ